MGAEKVTSKAREVAKELLKLGFTLQMYSAYSTNSIYIKLDYGVCNSIRISDHNGKKNLNYRYNLTKGIIDENTVKKQFTRYYYPFTKSDNLIKQILTDREYRMKQYSMPAYQAFMRKNQEQHADNLGFWRQAVKIETEADIDKVLK